MSRRSTNFLTESVATDYSVFAPRLYNLCKKYGLRRRRMRLASAFCSDKNPGYPLLFLTKHFGTFPVEVSTASGRIDYREIPEEHDADLVIVQASHMGCASRIKERADRQKSEWMNVEQSRICRYQDQTLRWYQSEYHFARNGISLWKENDRYLLIISNQLLDVGRRDGLFLNMDKLVQLDAVGNYAVAKQYRNAKAFVASEDFVLRVAETCSQGDGAEVIGDRLSSDLFYFKRNFAGISGHEWYRSHELNVRMPNILTSQSPVPAFVKMNIQIEFDHTFRAIVEENKYRGRNLVYIAGIHQDALQTADQEFPPTLFIPWAAFIQQSNGTHVLLKQQKLVELLGCCSSNNTEEINLEDVLYKKDNHNPLRTVDLDTFGN